jgi:hypothetical protein
MASKRAPQPSAAAIVQFSLRERARSPAGDKAKTQDVTFLESATQNRNVYAESEDCLHPTALQEY